MSSQRAPIELWLCDLTYTQQTISSDVMPAAVGHIAMYAKEQIGHHTNVRLFKFPESLVGALEHDTIPDVVGFSNYIWNRDLSSEFARIIKKHHPKVVTVFGGPNYPTKADEQADFLRRHPMFDFYIAGEGEIAFAKLVAELVDCGFDPAEVPLTMPSVHRILPDGELHAAVQQERIRDIGEIPSPYLSGLLEEYFDGVMLPIVQTNRGCPFRCTFCVEGETYFNKVAKSNSRKVFDELDYIADRMATLRKQGRARSDLHIADSNFGMFKEDLAVCEHIGSLQDKVGYPEYINVATGKNNKERVLEAARLINGSLRLSGSVQSLDKQVLANIDRANIDEQQIMDLALSASEIDANSYSEIILGLPGDTVKAHLGTIETIVEADFNTIALYQLMLLPGTDLATTASIEKWGMQTQYRVLPRCFGYWDVLGESVNAAEIEEICVANSSLSFDDYLSCRHMHLVVNVFFNDGVFKEVLRLLKLLRIPRFDWLRRVWEHRGNAAFDAFVGDFLEETAAELWEDEAGLREQVRHRDILHRYIDGELGANLIFKYKTLALIRHTADLAVVATETLVETLTEHGVAEVDLQLGRELIEFGRLRMTDILVGDSPELRGSFTHDVAAFSQAVRPADTAEFALPEPAVFSFSQSPQQRETVADFLAVYGDSVMGLSRMLSKVYVRRLFREASADLPEGGGETARREMLLGDTQLTGLNEF